MKMKMIRLLAMVMILAPLSAAAQKAAPMTIPEYITKYSEVAKAEMRKTGIPASIKLAQGILESSYGNSLLAVKANNHFGIKCGGTWTGPSMIQDDDTKNECFRKYESAFHSYADHSAFLKGKERYASLFELKKTDYKAWAHGLQKAGYATNPQYATRLINIIEERELHHFDHEEESNALTSAEKEFYKSVDKKSYLFNGRMTVIALPNEMPMDIAAKYDTDLSALLRFNDMKEGDHIIPGTRIYLEPKKSKGHDASHRVEKGETMHSISQKQGIKLKALYKKNMMKWGQEPAEGEVLCLQAKCKSMPKLKSDEEMKEDIKEKIQQRVDEAVKENQLQQHAGDEAVVAGIKMDEQPAADPVAEEKPMPVEAPVIAEAEPEVVLLKGEPLPEEKIEAPVPPKTAEAAKPEYHIVAPQETLYRIATKYGITVDELKAMNNLASNSISIGQKLVVSAAPEPVIEEPVEEKPQIDEAALYKPANEPVVEEKQPKYHVVEPQETLYKIAGKYSISVAELKVMNKLESHEVSVGQKLLVGYAGVTPTDPREETVNVSTSKPQESQDQPSYHKVQQGETLYSIAQKHGLDMEELKTLNKLTSDDIPVGKILKLR